MFKMCFLFILLMAAATGASAQACKFSPADCPVNGWDSWGTPDDSVEKLLNPVIPREVAMENRLRQWTTHVMKGIAEKEGWEVAEVDEGGSSGFRAADGSVLSYDLRPPHWFLMTYQFIVNQDSLQAWRTWLTDFGARRMNSVNDYAGHATAVQDQVQACMDSANHYSDLKGKYMTEHFEAYQKALLAGNKTVTNNYEKDVARYDKKITEFTDKAGTIGHNPGSEEKEKNFDAEAKALTQKFWDGTILIVQIGYNEELAKTVGSPLGGLGSPAGMGPPVGGPGASTNSVANEGFTLARWYSNSDPDNLSIDIFPRSRNILVMLLGPWVTKADQWGSYRPVYYGDKASRDQSTNKKIKSDQLQTIDFHLSGNARAIRRFLGDMPVREFNGMIARP